MDGIRRLKGSTAMSDLSSAGHVLLVVRRAPGHLPSPVLVPLKRIIVTFQWRRFSPASVQYAIINNRAPSRARLRRPSNRKRARFHALSHSWRYGNIPALQVQSRRVASLHVLEEDLGGRGRRLSEGSSEFASESAKLAPVYSVAFPTAGQLLL